MAKKKSHNEDEIIEQQVHDIEEKEKSAAKDDESDIKKPKLTGSVKKPLPKHDFEHPRTNNQSRTVIE